MNALGDYAVVFTASARRNLATVPETIASAAAEFCFGPLAANPPRVGKPLRRELAGYHSARRGSYRVIYRIDQPAHRVFVLRVEQRGGVYRVR